MPVSFEDLYDYWFKNEKIWFSSNNEDDLTICELFSNLYNEPIDNYKIKTNKKYAIGVVLLYDQVSRHLIRVNNEETIYRWSRDKFIQQTNFISYSNSMLGYIYYSTELNPDEFAFMMLPLRHTNDYKKIVWVINETWKKINDINNKIDKINNFNNNYVKSLESTELDSANDLAKSTNLKDLLESTESIESTESTKLYVGSDEILLSESLEKYKRFLKATYSRAIIQSDDVDLVNYYSCISSDNNIKNEIDTLINKYSDILDNNFLENFKIKLNDFSIDNDIKEIIKKSQKSQKYSDEISKTFIDNIENFFNIGKYKYSDENTKGFKVSTETQDEQTEQIKQKYGKKKSNKLVLSISGGVDSMICSWILKINKIKFCCVHINYSNRPESIREEQFVIEWCRILGIKLWVRRIEEINRLECMKNNLRDLYESYTKDVRFKTYQKVCLNPWVILGHNQDDCFENIMTNISKKTKYENLLGMELYSSIDFFDDKINFLRPMLSINKKSIYKYAQINHIPYLFDSTPKWSQRGKIRDIVRPTLENWNPSIVSGFFELSSLLRDSDQLINKMVNDWSNKIIKEQIICEPNEIPLNKLFWEKFFHVKNIKISSHSLDNFIRFIDKIINGKTKIDINVFTKYEVNKFYQIKMLKTKYNNIMMVFNNRS